MNNDFEKILEKVIVSTDKRSRLDWRLSFKNYLRKKTLTMAGMVAILVFVILVVFRSGTEQGLRIKRPEDVVLRDKLLARVAELIILPDERPFIATLVDYELLKDNPFFKDAKEGDKLLLFEGANKAILYDPKSNKLLNTGTIVETGIKYR